MTIVVKRVWANAVEASATAAKQQTMHRREPLVMMRIFQSPRDFSFGRVDNFGTAVRTACTAAASVIPPTTAISPFVVHLKWGRDFVSSKVEWERSCPFKPMIA